MSPKERALWQIKASEVRAGQSWHHRKTGGRYTVVVLAINEATQLPVVVYEGEDGVAWTRNLDKFIGNADDGKARFLRLEDGVTPTPAVPPSCWSPGQGT